MISRKSLILMTSVLLVTFPTGVLANNQIAQPDSISEEISQLEQPRIAPIHAGANAINGTAQANRSFTLTILEADSSIQLSGQIDANGYWRVVTPQLLTEGSLVTFCYTHNQTSTQTKVLPTLPQSTQPINQTEISSTTNQVEADIPLQTSQVQAVTERVLPTPITSEIALTTEPGSNQLLTEPTSKSSSTIETSQPQITPEERSIEASSVTTETILITSENPITEQTQRNTSETALTLTQSELNNIPQPTAEVISLPEIQPENSHLIALPKSETRHMQKPQQGEVKTDYSIFDETPNEAEYGYHTWGTLADLGHSSKELLPKRTWSLSETTNAPASNQSLTTPKTSDRTTSKRVWRLPKTGEHLNPLLPLLGLLIISLVPKVMRYQKSH